VTRTLLVDDHPLFADGLKDMLSRRGFTVLGVARDGLDALHQARALHPDLILMDIQMPGCDGLTATRLIKAELPAVQIVILTMAEDDEHLFEAIKSGACGYLLKTLDTNEFLGLLESLADGAPPFAPGLAQKVLQELTQPMPPDTDVQRSLAELSPRQQQILTLAAQGLTYKAIGLTLGLTERTIKYHMGEIIQRLHLQNRAQVLAYVRQRTGAS
jgi:DNA-binding NarL/FixJ family response regulator